MPQITENELFNNFGDFPSKIDLPNKITHNHGHMGTIIVSLFCFPYSFFVESGCKKVETSCDSSTLCFSILPL